MKKRYTTPTIKVAVIEHINLICTSNRSYKPGDAEDRDGFEFE